ncbi:MAG TPA: lipoyl(octanoyl) transferase LipB [Baekduia sp.]|uniref:lipoyl(octanoyl) transferase LipB n=1 Tax=Baekduia sp. TaxID=2600305 RepID=UPI002D791C64|nr:lipoyl(octanoyl) transferase LipB [Baekduia sp.]HET6509833.1 lipoyl(octanoyl) transferase LipB [Baekduia sp.]
MELWSVHLGRVPYREGLALQQRVREARRQDLIPDTILTLEHDPVYTRGRRSDPAELPFGDAWYAERGIDVVDVDRGGKVTYHGPGQLVAYPIARVDDVMAFVTQLEDAMVAALREEGIADARGRAADGRDFTGVWVGDDKIGSIGLHISHGVTMHGLAINLDDAALEPFTWIVPCGLGGVAMTSVEALTGRAGRLDCVRKRVTHHLARALDARQRIVTPQRLERALTAAPVA